MYSTITLFANPSPQSNRRTWPVAAAFLLQTIATFLFLFIPIARPAVIQPHYVPIRLTAPSEFEPPQPQVLHNQPSPLPKPRIAPTIRETSIPAQEIIQKQSRLNKPAATAPTPPPIVTQAPPIVPIPVNSTVVLRPALHLNVFESQPAQPSAQLPATVSTGNFNEPAPPSNHHPIIVQETAFSLQPSDTTTHPRTSQPPSPLTSAVAIESKPEPIYTEEARRLHIEGEVIVKVIFTATGQVRVTEVVKGLGHGLDEAAVHAAEQIHFVPAQRAGEKVDCPATLHILFTLS